MKKGYGRWVFSLKAKIGSVLEEQHHESRFAKRSECQELVFAQRSVLL